MRAVWQQGEPERGETIIAQGQSDDGLAGQRESRPIEIGFVQMGPQHQMNAQTEAVDGKDG